MKVSVELYGATKDLSKNNFLELEVKKNNSFRKLEIKEEEIGRAHV